MKKDEKRGRGKAGEVGGGWGGWERRERGQLIRHPSEKVRIFVGGIWGERRRLQMWRTAGCFPLPRPLKRAPVKTHLPVNILARLWVISPVCSPASQPSVNMYLHTQKKTKTAQTRQTESPQLVLIATTIHPAAKKASEVFSRPLCCEPEHLSRHLLFFPFGFFDESLGVQQQETESDSFPRLLPTSNIESINFNLDSKPISICL